MKKKNTVKMVCAAAAVLICLFVSVGFVIASQEHRAEMSVEEAQISDTLLAGLDIEAQHGVIPAEMLSAEPGQKGIIALSENESKQLSDTLKSELSKYYSVSEVERISGLGDRTLEEVRSRAIGEQGGAVSGDITVRSGVCNFYCSDIKVDGTAAQASSTYVYWIICVEPGEKEKNVGKWQTTLIISRWDGEYTLEKIDGKWLITGTGKLMQEFAPDDYDRVKGVYNTFEEALTAAEEIDPETENPWKAVP